ncbi:MAG: AraC family transcriptional regulator [Bacteroidales bacterium]|jgi:AraC family transcriptional activator of pobA|nr:AraC family transcriptional regulator [Bacteroidales bacterium]
MYTQPERLEQLDKALLNNKSVCSSRGVLHSFPFALKEPYMVNGIGLVVCRRGSFTFTVNGKNFSVGARKTLFIPESTLFHINDESEDLEVYILVYHIVPIRNFMGNSVMIMSLHLHYTSTPSYAWNTGEEEDILKYMSLLDSILLMEDDTFNLHERELLLLALTHRLCSLYNRKFITTKEAVEGRQNNFIRLLQLIEQYYTEHRGVGFYANKLCLSPKYLSALSKSICGYTVQELVFKSIIRKSISLLSNSHMSIKEVADYFNFPNASSFGTFFKKQTGVSPKHYCRNNGMLFSLNSLTPPPQTDY